MSEDFIEYRVRPVARFIVTRYEQSGTSAGCSTHGEFDNHETAYAVGYALAKAEHASLGYEPGDMRIRYPAAPSPRDAGSPGGQYIPSNSGA